jgi:hypothetical protein
MDADRRANALVLFREGYGGTARLDIRAQGQDSLDSGLLRTRDDLLEVLS